MTNIPRHKIGPPPLSEFFCEQKGLILWRIYAVLSMTLNYWHDKLSGVMNRYVLLSVLGRDSKPPFYGRP